MPRGFKLGDNHNPAPQSIFIEKTDILLRILLSSAADLREGLGGKRIPLHINEMKMEIFHLEKEANIHIFPQGIQRMPIAGKVHHQGAVFLVGSVLNM